QYGQCARASAPSQNIGREPRSRRAGRSGAAAPSKPLASSASSASPSSWLTRARGRANDEVAQRIAVLVFGHMRWMLPLGVLAGLAGWAACPHGPNGTTGPQPPVPGSAGAGAVPLPGTDPSDGRLELPAIPARIEVTTSAPTDGSAPDKRSPILDILK